MAIIRVENLTKSFGIKTVFAEVSFDIKTGDKIGLVGANGSGKTTLLKCMLGLEEYDSGRVFIPGGEQLGYVEQGTVYTSATLWEELLQAYSDILALKDKMQDIEGLMVATSDEDELAQLMKKYGSLRERFERGGGYEYQNVIKKIAFGLGFTEEDLSRPADAFSGGQKTRISLAKALVRQPDFLFLDEPTNHLDIKMVEWLEDYLTKYNGGLLVISHDRYFLDNIANKIIELKQGKTKVFSGNYSEYKVKSRALEEAQQTAYDKQQEYINKTEEYIRRYKAGIKSKQARGRASQLARLERLTAPVKEDAFCLKLDDAIDSADRVAELMKVSVAYQDNVIFEKLSLLLRRGERVALIGPNGAGKTTLLKILLGELAPTSGDVKLGKRVRVGYFAQEHELLNIENTLLAEIMNEYDFSEERARALLGAMLFRGDEVYKTIKELSGGERARVAFLKLMLSKANFLVLDEPTNHLDIPAKEAVERALADFSGTLLVVSHDRYFLDNIAERVLELSDGKLTEYLGNYSYYKNKKAELEKLQTVQVKEGTENKEKKIQEIIPEISVKKTENTPQKMRPLMRNAAKQYEKLELEIRELEVMLRYIEMQLNDPANHADIENSRRLAAEYDEYKAKIDEKYDEWAELSEAMD